MTTVVNCKVQYIRPLGYDNLKEWIEDPNNIYIGRAGVVFIDKKRFPPTASRFANPFKIGADGTRDEVLEKYRAYITQRLNQSQELRDELIGMKDKNLGCWCHPEPCHGNVLMELIDTYLN